MVFCYSSLKGLRQCSMHFSQLWIELWTELEVPHLSFTEPVLPIQPGGNLRVSVGCSRVPRKRCRPLIGVMELYFKVYYHLRGALSLQVPFTQLWDGFLLPQRIEKDAFHCWGQVTWAQYLCSLSNHASRIEGLSWLHQSPSWPWSFCIEGVLLSSLVSRSLFCPVS